MSIPRQRVACVVVLLAGVRADGALVVVRFEPTAQTVNLGDTFSVDIVADIDTPVVGWGLDQAVVNPGMLSISAPFTIGPSWLPATAADGDGLAGLASPLPPVNGSVMGLGVVLATLSFSADAVGSTALLTSVTPNDLTEGFALDPTGFANVTFEPGQITVIPEPSSLMLFIIGCVLIRRRRQAAAQA